MRKYIALAALFIFFYLQSISQFSINDIVQRKIDSLKKNLNSVKGNTRVEYLNNISEGLFWIWDEDTPYLLDSACNYATRALSEAKKTGYKRGLGYAYVRLECCEGGRADTNKNISSHFAQAGIYAKQAIQIGEELKDNILIGAAYKTLGWMERWKGDLERSKNYIEAAISYYEKPINLNSKRAYSELTYTDCPQCQGNEFTLGDLYMDLNNLHKGFTAAKEAIIEKAISYYQKANAKTDMAEAYLTIANVVSASEGVEKGIEQIKKAVLLFNEDKNEHGQLDAYLALCAAYFNLGDFEKGIDYSKKSLVIAEKRARANGTINKKNIDLGESYYWMGRFYTIAGDLETASAYFWKAYAYYPESRLDRWRIVMGEFHHKKRNYDSAMYYLAPALNKDYPGARYVVSNLYISMQQYDKALLVINEAIKKATGNNNLTNLGRLYTTAAMAYYYKNDYRTALTNARMGFAILKKNSRNVELINNYLLLSDIFIKLGKDDSAYTYLKKYTVLKDSVWNKQLYIRLNDYKKENEQIKRTSQINLLQKDNLIKEQLLKQEFFLRQQSYAQLSLADKSNEIKDQQLQIKDQKLREQILLKEQKQSLVTLLDKESKLKDQKLKQQSLIRNALIAGLFLFLLLGIIVYRWLALKRKNDRLLNEKKQVELQQQSTDLEMQALRAQMNPHFIFNCLSSINKFILKNESRSASDYLTRFSRLIRKVLTNSQLSMIPLSDEIETLKLYLDMERLRFDNAFDYNIIYANTIEPETLYIPSMLLQPFCENAIWHGLMHKEGHGKLEIEMRTENDQLYCTIADNGVGREKAAIMKSKSGEKQKSYGLKITTERLALFNNDKVSESYYYSEDVLDEQRNVAGTRVHLVIKYKDAVQELING